ncbi:MAG: DUF4194 domain-containing protein, partial [Lachnospiraceae bacterium]|nr:DUF4194 domain-containing protein [Lachnospiraceae bacterium]
MFTSGEKELFQRVCRRLLKSTFIVKEKDDDSKKLYTFVAKNEESISSYLGHMGFDIKVDRDNGVAMLENSGDSSDSGKIQANRLRLRKADTVVLCCLWTAYLDRIRRGNLSKGIIISLLDLKQELEKYGFREDFDGKTLMTDILKLLAKYNLVEVSGKLGEPDCSLKIYPSIQFALDGLEFRSFAEETSKKVLHSKAAADIDEEEMEESDYDE